MEQMSEEQYNLILPYRGHIFAGALHPPGKSICVGVYMRLTQREDPENCSTCIKQFFDYMVNAIIEYEKGY